MNLSSRQAIAFRQIHKVRQGIHSAWGASAGRCFGIAQDSW